MTGVVRNARRPGVQRARLLGWLCAFAIGLQCILVQGHIHTPFAPGEVATIDQGVITGAAPAPVKDQGDRSRDGCFICQQMVMAGAGILPSTTVPVLIERELALAPPPVEVAIVASQTSHNWRSRAPPVSFKV